MLCLTLCILNFLKINISAINLIEEYNKYYIFYTLLTIKYFLYGIFYIRYFQKISKIIFDKNFSHNTIIFVLIL
ncbi:hypothetical protein D9V71_01600 [Buchnera aphidicola (Macrosiphum euphorbiae)]|nr:hypothetical protein D9V71_01600 [Buchnera aphidicola (Macrosiphum euphorbiae)]